MNERIRQLAKQAEIKWQHQEDVIYSTMTLEQFEKFAELIVLKCCDIFVELRTRPADLSVLDVKKHFGFDC